nr:hypothetical protein [Propionicimonas sp.]
MPAAAKPAQRGDGTAGDSDDEVVGVVIGCVEGDLVQAEEHDRRQPPESFVAVDQGVIPHERLQQDRSLLINPRVCVRAEHRNLRAVHG